MSRSLRFVGALLALLIGVTVAAALAIAAEKSCQQITRACKDAGFSAGANKDGKGIMADCVRPIMQGGAAPAKASLPLPTVDPKVVAACVAANPQFGQPGGKNNTTSAGGTETAGIQPAQTIDASAAAGTRPNIVFILADDFSRNLLSDAMIGKSMPSVAAMQADGANFANYFVTDSLCCPSRSSIFTGKLPHDTGVFKNTGADGGFKSFNAHGNQPETFAVALQQAGYKTAMMGKYLNGYEPAKDGPPVGWSEWDVAGNGYPQFNYDLNEDGKVVHFAKDPQDYLTDVVAGLGEDFIKKNAGGPFFLEIATFAPHAPYVPAPRNANDFPTLAYDRAAPYGARPDATASQWLKQIPALTPADETNMDKAFRMRNESDEAIDKMIGDIRALLKSLNIDKNTYIVFSSDNGYHMGEYSLRPGKMTPFETDIHVPLIVVGPGVGGGRTIDQVAENIDLCPTFTELGGAPQPGTTKPDGHSLVALLHAAAGTAPPNWRQLALVEHHHPPKDPTDPDVAEPNSGDPPSYEAIRTTNGLYVEYQAPQNDAAYYDLKTDPLELKNIAASLDAARRNKLHAALMANANCHGANACWTAQAMTP
jgi:N-acetylglucosamine-6-sulfatase